MNPALLSTELPFPVRRGKVRDVYDLGETLLIVATDRISAFDCILPSGIPGKGVILTALSRFWFAKFGRTMPHHLLETDVARYPAALRQHADVIRGRSMLVRKTQVVPIECVARGYIAGSGWKEYQQSSTICGVRLPVGLRPSDRLPAPIFTPATKAETGHDENISFDRMVSIVGLTIADELRERTLRLYTQAAEYALARGVIIADTKFEFGVLPDGTILLIDEILTPDSSRFWPARSFEPGREQPSFDKQFVRNWLEAQPWDKRPPAPALPIEVIVGTRERYLEAYRMLTGHPLQAEL